ncbi:hypothetical protein [Chryseolinea sp. H1M3-3]|uniref:hypothetical protein n=1 Tax=Chryseolinea sp. H1M3-3 TaxID=3034144 RepID=UPI0023EAACDF|nr:hypothetical protein [Chryseolinea sp. H1M3-3]
MKYLYIVVLFILPVALSTCRDEDELPPITMEGKNTFGCKVNGKLWLPQGRAGQSGTHVDLTFPGDTVVVNIYASAGESGFVISIYDVPNLQINKPYDLATDQYYTSYLNWSNGISCDSDSIISGNVTLSRFDRPINIISGTFEFTTYSNECSGSVSITEGRFDIAEIFY